MNLITDVISPNVIPGLIWAYRFAADGSSSRVPDEETRAAVAHKEGWLWVHINLADARARDWIGETDVLPKDARELLLSADNHLRLEVYDETVAGVFADLQKEFGRESEDIAYLRFALNDRLVISTRKSALYSVEEARQAIDEGRRYSSAVSLLEAIVEKFADACSLICEELADKVDEIEDRIVDEALHDERKALSMIRRTSVRVHRQLHGLHSVFARLERANRDKMSPPLIEAAHRLATRLDTLNHDLHAVQDRARLLQEECAGKVADQTNRLLYIISILTALFVPPTFVTGIFGMNTKGLIFADNENAFIYAMLMCVVSAAAVFAVVKMTGRRK